MPSGTFCVSDLGISIHERPSRKKNDGEQRIDIYFTHIGSMPDSEPERADHCRDKAISARTAEFSDAHQKPISTIRAYHGLKAKRL